MSSSLSDTPPIPPPSTCAEPPVDWDGWFKHEVHCHDSTLKTYLHSSFPTIRDVEDVVQESYLRIWKTRATQRILSTKAFLFTIARRVALDRVRRDQRSPLVAAKDVDTAFVSDGRQNTCEATDLAYDINLLAAAVDSLPSRCRQVFILCHLQGLGQREAALGLGISENTVAVQSARGLRRCEKFLRVRLRHQ